MYKVRTFVVRRLQTNSYILLTRGEIECSQNDARRDAPKVPFGSWCLTGR